jgi:hypothetical protein
VTVTVRRILAGAAAFLLGLTVVRNAALDALVERDPARASAFWNSHPAAEIAVGMTEIAKAARSRRAVSPEVFARIDDGARKSPLAPEPFLVHGVQAQLSNNVKLAEQFFLAAAWRDPRSLPAHYFLAEHYFRAGDADRGLREVVSLASLSPRGAVSSAPYLAAFARDPANWSKMRTVFRAYPWLEQPTLVELAREPRNARAILGIAQADQLKPSSEWLAVLLNTLVAAGDYRQAKAIWASISNVGSGAQSLLFDPGFSKPEPPPPFNWTLTSSSVGLAERQPGGRLHAIFYGQEDGVLARQLVVLPAGSYRLSMRLLAGASQPQALSWAITCVGSQAPLASAPLNVVAARGWSFEVPANCPAQYLDLAGSSSDLPQQSEVMITGLSMTGGGSG